MHELPAPVSLIEELEQIDKDLNLFVERFQALLKECENPDRGTLLRLRTRHKDLRYMFNHAVEASLKLARLKIVKLAHLSEAPGDLLKRFDALNTHAAYVLGIADGVQDKLKQGN